MYVDFEDSAPSIVSRLTALGADCKAVAERFVYLRPDEALGDRALRDFDRVLARKPSLVIIDGVTEAYGREGLSPLSNEDVAAWLALLPRYIVLRTEAAVVLLDHVVKDRDTRGRWPLGAQHKLAGIDVALSLRIVQPFGRGREGSVAISVEKDRPGAIREFADNGMAALMVAVSAPDASVTITLGPPEAHNAVFRPTRLMHYLSEAVAGAPGLSTRAVREAVKGDNNAKDLALELLVSEGYVERRSDGQARRFYPIRPYREAGDDAADLDP